MPPRRRPRPDPQNHVMPNFTTQGYAPSHAQKRRQEGCSNEDAIIMLQNEWT